MYPDAKRNGEAHLAEQAKALISLLPAVMRNLFRMDDDLATELPLAQLKVCVMLLEGPRSMSALSRETGVSLSAMTQIADRLERSQMVRRVAEGTDRRVRRLQLTPHGEHLLHRRDEERMQSAISVLKYLSLDEREETLRSIKLLLKACGVAKDEKNGKEAFTKKEILA
jgi:DNA-binding MarR family transcriptional regulator